MISCDQTANFLSSHPAPAQGLCRRSGPGVLQCIGLCVLGSLIPAPGSARTYVRTAPARMRASLLQEDHSQAIHVEPSQVSRKSKLQLLSLAACIVKAKNQRQPCAEAIKVEAVAALCFALRGRWFSLGAESSAQVCDL